MQFSDFSIKARLNFSFFFIILMTITVGMLSMVVMKEMTVFHSDINNYSTLVEKSLSVQNITPEMKTLHEEMISMADNTLLYSHWFGWFVFIFGILFAVFIYFVQRSIIRPLLEFRYVLEKVSQGDLRFKGEHPGKDEISGLVKDLNNMITGFGDMVDKSLVVVNEVVAVTGSLKMNSTKTNDGAHSQSSHAQSIVASTEEMNQTIADIAKNAGSVSEAATEAVDIAQAGTEIAENAVQSMNEVFANVEELSLVIENLTNKAKEIGGVSVMIKSIADQTNLLALNAAIEAARAGENGRGFAVVADEVRKLAEKTIHSTGEISGKIEAIQKEIGQAEASMKEATVKVKKTATYIEGGVKSTLHSVAKSSEEVRDQITRIAAAVEEQSSTANDMASNVENMSGIAKDVDCLSQEVMGEVNKLNGIAEELRQVVGGFKTKSGELTILDLAKTDHRIFVQSLGMNLAANKKVDVSKIPDHHGCRFGKWYDSHGKGKWNHLPGFAEIDKPHALIHKLAKDAATFCNSGDGDHAKELYRDVEIKSEEIISLLDKVKQEALKSS